MPRRTVTDLSAWPSLSLEGALIAPAMIARVNRLDANEQEEAQYGVRRGLTIREEISLAFRVGQSHVGAFARAGTPSAAATRRFVREFLRETFGFDDLVEGDGPVAFIAGGRVPVVVVPPAETLDRRSPTLSTDRPRSAAFALQDHLNASDGALWGLVTNGAQLRLMRDNASLTRPAYIEADLAQIFANEDAASFAALWLLIHRSRFGAAGAPAADCALERWREAGGREGEAARDRLAGQVREALGVLGSGFLEANPELARRLQSGEVPLTGWFNELLRLVYRLIFLMVAEDRNLLHPADADADARALYAEGYSMGALRARSVRRAAWDRHHDRYEGLKIVFRSLAHGEPALGLPALGGLFARDQLPTLEGAALRNRALMEALFRLAWLKDAGGIVPVNWRAMQTEELGSVYESLLELQPQLADGGRRLAFAQDAAEQRGNQRKTTGSYYTPDSLVQALVDTALDPVLDRTEAEADDPAAALLALRVIDPACGSGHFLLAAARRIATRLARVRADGTPSLADFRHALRDVARCCLHGVDRNPMAVELTKVALWIETVDPGLPLGFFDAQVRCGDSLLGVFDLDALRRGVPDDAYKPLAGDDRTAARDLQRRNRDEREGQGRLDFRGGGGRLPERAPLQRRWAEARALPETTVEEVAEKALAVARLRASKEWYDLELAADLYVSAFLTPKTADPARPRPLTTADVWRAMAGSPPEGRLMGVAQDLARAARAFHWPLEFPDVMAAGGFDAVLGNPPWEVMQLGEEEYFSARIPEIAALAGAARKRAIAALERDDPAVFAQFTSDKRRFEASNEFVRSSGRFDLTARGKINTYSLFAELFAKLPGPRGRAGVIVPTGIATDATTAPFFASLVEGRRLASLVDFENRAALFPAVDSRMKFCLLTLGRGELETHFAFFLNAPADLAEPERNFTLSPAQIATINPNTRTAPVFRSRADAALTAKIYANAPVLIEEGRGAAGNPWGVEFRQGLFNMTSDSGLFRTARQLANAGFVRDGADWLAPGVSRYQPDPALSRIVYGAIEEAFSQLPSREDATPQKTAAPNPELDLATSELNKIFGTGGTLAQKGPRLYVPLYEAKMIHQFDHRWAGYDAAGETAGDLPPDHKRDPAAEPAPRYWVPQAEVEARLSARGWTRGWLMGWRDIARATDERTVIATVFPRAGVGDTLLIKMPMADDARLFAANIGNLGSLALDYSSRQKIGGTHLKYNIFKQLPVLPPAFYTSPRLAFVTPRVLALTYTSHALAPFARDLGHDGPPFPWNEDRRAHLRAELDAFYARAYGLDRDELRYILDPADVKGPDYPSETFRVLKQNEIRKHGEYRTRRLVLQAWDSFEADGTFAGMGM